MNPQLKPIIGIGEGNIDILINFFDTDTHNAYLQASTMVWKKVQRLLFLIVRNVCMTLIVKDAF